MGLLFIGAFGTLGRTPLYFILKFYDPLIYLISFTFMGFYFIDKSVKQLKWNGFERLMICILFGMPLYSAVVSNYYWNQPMLFGLMTQQLWFYSSVAFILFYLLKTQLISLYQLRDIMLSISWIQLPLYLLLALILDPHNYYLTTSFAYCSAAKGCGWMFDITFLSFAYFYYLILFFKTTKWKYLIPVLIFLTYIVIEYQKRAMNIAIIGTSGIYFFFQVPFKKKIFYVIILSFVFSLLLGLIYLIQPEFFNRFSNMYKSLIEVFQGEESNDMSANSRITQIIYLGLYYAKHPSSIFFGNGKWSDNWEQNPLWLYGRFYPSDLGILGAFFIYGIFGILLVQFEYLQTILWMRKVKSCAADPFFMTLKYYLLFYYIRSIPSGGSYFYPGAGITAVIVTIIYFFYYRENKAKIDYPIQ